jgi:hypothetical protein
MGEMRNAYTILVGTPEWKRPLEDLHVNGKLLKWILGKLVGKVQTGYIWVGIGTGGRLW